MPKIIMILMLPCAFMEVTCIYMVKYSVYKLWVIIFWLPGNKFSSTMFPMRSLTVGKWASRHIYLIRWRAISWYVWHFGQCNANYQGFMSKWVYVDQRGTTFDCKILFIIYKAVFILIWKTMNSLNNNLKFTVTWFFLVYCTRLLQMIF